ncbi:MAG: PQQ-dependent sugar dehydrogenase, partial [Desulfuromusa sp.]|nr:PQQ-dependent sugar dehydrogenase [Desulfuromusa sp.]
MKKKLLLALGCSLLLSGWFSAFWLNSMPLQSNLYILAPTLLLGAGMGLVHKTVGGKLTALTLAFTALTAILTLNQVFPSRSVSISAFKQRMQDGGQAGHSIPVITQDSDRSGSFAHERFLETFADVEVHLFAKLPGPARMMTFDPVGNLYVTIPKLGAIYQLRDDDHDGHADESILYHVGMDDPHGLLWDDGKLYVAETSQLLELQDTDYDNQVDQVRIVMEGLPDDGGHWTRSLAQGKDGFLYLSVGSRCNACEEEDPMRATVLKVNPETGKSSIFARGLRNTVGLSFSPDGETLWGSDNGRDQLGDELPPDEINQIIAGGNYGWPNCYGKQ